LGGQAHDEVLQRCSPPILAMWTGVAIQAGAGVYQFYAIIFRFIGNIIKVWFLWGDVPVCLYNIHCAGVGLNPFLQGGSVTMIRYSAGTISRITVMDTFPFNQGGAMAYI
jgi:hypothetical protein